MSAEMSIVTAGWFMLIAFIFSHHLFKNEIQKVQHIAERFIGIALILLGLKVAFSTSK
jgi:threonine/homoserine/homoserine lactone efflux protein